MVALFTRAWIEINRLELKNVSLTVALFTRAWIEITHDVLSSSVRGGRPLHEGVD